MATINPSETNQISLQSSNKVSAGKHFFNQYWFVFYDFTDCTIQHKQNS